MKLLQDSWSEMLILDHMHHRMHNNLPDETQLPNGQVISMMVVAVRMRMNIVVLLVRMRIRVILRSWVNWGMVEGRFSKWF